METELTRTIEQQDEDLRKLAWEKEAFVCDLSYICTSYSQLGFNHVLICSEQNRTGWCQGRQNSQTSGPNLSLAAGISGWRSSSPFCTVCCICNIGACYIPITPPLQVWVERARLELEAEIRTKYESAHATLGAQLISVRGFRIYISPL